MRFFTAFFATETNTYAAAPTGWGGFREYGIFHGDAGARDPLGMGGQFMANLRRLLEEDGHEMIESVTAFAQPFGRTVREVYERLRDDILADLAEAGPLDGVILTLHGAMVVDGYDDCEGDLLTRVRELVGPHVPIGVEIDLHCHFTELMREQADAIICFKEYPHVDALLRQEELVRIVVGMARGAVRPTTAVFDCKMVGIWHTTREPMAGFVRRMQETEKLPGVLSVSLGHGFPWADVAESGAKLWVITDRDPALAARLAGELGQEFWTLREETRVPTLSVSEALAQVRALQGPGPIVIADVADNAGGGAMGDSTFVLREVLDAQMTDVAMASWWDVGAVQICADAGVGARVSLRLGGKCGPASGDPVDLTVTVKAIQDDFFQGGLTPGGRSPLGRSVWVQAANGLDIVLASMRSQVFAPDIFTGLGIDLSGKKLIVVKSVQHFHAQFAPLARQILYVSTPGSMSFDFANLPYRVRNLDYWPRVADPHGADRARWTGPDSAPPGELHTIDGLRLHLQRSGPATGHSKLPTVVLEAGGGSAAVHYTALSRLLAQKYSVIAYDRPGMGWSDFDGRPLDAVRNSRRLHALLAAAAVRGPIVLIGHSLGGLLNRVYTGLYPGQVAGVVMLDASHPKQFDDLYSDNTTGGSQKQLDTLREMLEIQRTTGEVAPALEAVLSSFDQLYPDPPELAQQLRALIRPEAVDATALESAGLRQVARQAGSSPDFGSRPLAVLWSPVISSGAAALLGTSGENYLKRWKAYQEDIGRLSTRSRVLALDGSDHGTIAALQPYIGRVVQEVDRLMEEVGGSN